MKTQAKFLLTILILMTTAACSLGGTAKAPVKRLTVADYPTPVPTEIPASPTPFPKVVTEAAAQQSQNDVEMLTPEITESVVASTATPIPQPTAIPTETPVTGEALIGVVKSYGLNVRDGAGISYNILEEVNLDDEVTILAENVTSGWVQVRTAAGTVGWVNPKYLTIEGDLSDLSGNAPIENRVGERSENTTANMGGTLLVQPQSGGEFFAINRDGTNLRSLTTGIDPALSPDGTQIAFTRWQGDSGSVWLINADGSNERQIIGEVKRVKSPSWSSDSEKIAVNFQEGGTEAPTQHCQNLALGKPNFNYWQAYDITQEIRMINGQPVPFMCWWMPADPHWKLRIVDVNTGDFEDMPAGEYAFAPAWDPANNWRVVSVGGAGLVWTDINRGVAEALTTDPSDRAPNFSPDGKYIVVTYRQDNHWDVHRLNADGTGRVRLTKQPLYAVIENAGEQNNVAPVFSPDGTQIAFLTDRTGDWQVWVMGIDGSNQRPMFSDAVNAKLNIDYVGNDARQLGWSR